MPRWLPRALRRLRALARAGRLRYTHKAMEEIAGLGLTRDDVREIVAGLRPGDAPTRVRSVRSGEWLYEFRPVASGVALYLKVLLRADALVVSCHEDQGPEVPSDAA